MSAGTTQRVQLSGGHVLATDGHTNNRIISPDGVHIANYSHETRDLHYTSPVPDHELDNFMHRRVLDDVKNHLKKL